MVKSYIPKTYEEALDLLSKNELVIMAGGTDLMVKNRSWSGLAPKLDKDVLFVSQLDSLNYVRRENEKIHIGATITLEKILNEEIIPEILKAAIRLMASPGIRHTATLAGNIGNASPAGDTLPVLYILNAKIVLESIEGINVVDISDFINGPGSRSMKSQEMIKEIIIDDVQFGYTMYEKVGGRKSDAISKVSFAGAVSSEHGMITDIRMAFGAVAPTVFRDAEFEARLLNTPAGDLRMMTDFIKDHYEPGINPISDQRSTAEYRTTCALNILGKFLVEAEKRVR